MLFKSFSWTDLIWLMFRKKHFLKFEHIHGLKRWNLLNLWSITGFFPKDLQCNVKTMRGCNEVMQYQAHLIIHLGWTCFYVTVICHWLHDYVHKQSICKNHRKHGMITSKHKLKNRTLRLSGFYKPAAVLKGKETLYCFNIIIAGYSV